MRTKKEDKKVVYGKDGRVMHKNSLDNISDTSNGFQKHPENINKAGRPRNPVLIAREKLAELLEDEYWLDNKEKEQTVILILKDAIEQYLTSENIREKQEWYKLLIGSSDNQAKKELPNNNAINCVVLLPAKNEPIPVQAQVVEEKDYQLDEN